MSIKERQFKIDAFTPETLPMERLAEYLLHFAKVLGEPERVHFVGVSAGSAVLRARIEPAAVARIEQRLSEASQGLGDPAAVKALLFLDDMLANDNAVGQILDEAGTEIIALQGRNRPVPLEYGPFREDGVLEGVVIKVGGEAANVPVWLRDGDLVYKKCSADRSMARKLSKYYDSDILLRVSGNGSWVRLVSGTWVMRSFEIKGFEVLDDTPLADVIQQLHAVDGADWGDDPLGDLAQLRAE